MAALQLDADLVPGLVDLVAEADQPVVDEDAADHDDGDDDQQDPGNSIRATSPQGTVWATMVLAGLVGGEGARTPDLLGVNETL